MSPTPPDSAYKLAQREAKRSKGRYWRIAPPPGSAPGEHLIEDSRGRRYRQEKDGSLRRVEPPAGEKPAVEKTPLAWWPR